MPPASSSTRRNCCGEFHAIQRSDSTTVQAVEQEHRLSAAAVGIPVGIMLADAKLLKLNRDATLLDLGFARNAQWLLGPLVEAFCLLYEHEGNREAHDALLTQAIDSMASLDHSLPLAIRAARLGAAESRSARRRDAPEMERNADPKAIGHQPHRARNRGSSVRCRWPYESRDRRRVGVERTHHPSALRVDLRQVGDPLTLADPRGDFTDPVIAPALVSPMVFTHDRRPQLRVRYRHDCWILPEPFKCFRCLRNACRMQRWLRVAVVAAREFAGVADAACLGVPRNAASRSQPVVDESKRCRQRAALPLRRQHVRRLRLFVASTQPRRNADRL